MGPINVNCAETIFKQMTSAHHFIHISQNILNLWMRLISQKLDIWGFNLSIRMRQFQSKLSQIWFFEIGSTSYYNNYGKIEFWLAPHFHQSFHLMNQIFPNAKMRSRFMILCQPSLNDILFIFPQPLLYKTPPLLHSKTHKNPISSHFLSFSEVE